MMGGMPMMNQQQSKLKYQLDMMPMMNPTQNMT